VDSLSIASSADNIGEDDARNFAGFVSPHCRRTIMERDFGLTVLGVVAGGALLALAIYTTLNWTAARIQMAAIDLPTPIFFIPK
jgi:hypothetical protein